MLTTELEHAKQIAVTGTLTTTKFLKPVQPFANQVRMLTQQHLNAYRVAQPPSTQCKPTVYVLYNVHPDGLPTTQRTNVFKNVQFYSHTQIL